MPGGFDSFGKTLMIMGAVIFVLGALLLLSGKLPWLGRLPGDIRVEKENFRLYAPITTMILISVVISILVRIFQKFF